MKEIEIQTSGGKKALMIIVGLLLTLISARMLIFPKSLSYSFVYNNEMFIRLIGLIGTMFFGAVSILYLKKAFLGQVGIIINEIGIIDRTSAVSVGLIKWEDILKIRVEKFSTVKMLLIDVKDPECIVKKEKSRWKRILMQKNMQLCGTPITISDNTLKCDVEELEIILNDSLKEHRSSNRRK